jgi:hypothetical protein
MKWPILFGNATNQNLTEDLELTNYRNIGGTLRRTHGFELILGKQQLRGAQTDAFQSEFMATMRRAQKGRKFSLPIYRQYAHLCKAGCQDFSWYVGLW